MTNIQGFGNGYVGPAAAEKTSTAAPAQPRTADSAQRSSAAATQDAASLSGTGSLLAAAGAHADDARAHKVEQVRAAIANGTYHVSAADVADKLIGNMLE